MRSKVEGIRNLRQAKGIQLSELAETANVDISELKKCERGFTLPGMDFFRAVGATLKVSAQDLRQVHARLLGRKTPGEGYTTRVSENAYVIARNKEPDPGCIRIMDLFCGVGGFSHGFELTKRFQTTAGIDLLPDRIETFTANHPTATAYCADISETSIHSLIEAAGEPEVVIGGPPCQGFSSIRPFRTLTEHDPRNNLFEEFALVVERARPPWFVVENVVGLLTHKKGETLERVTALFEEIGYFVQWKVLNAVYYGLPQRRERLFIVGNRQGIEFVWPEPTHYFDGRSMAGAHSQNIRQSPLFGAQLLPAVTLMEAIHDLPPLRAGESAEHYREDVEPTDYERAMRNREQKLTLHEATAHTPRMLEIIKHAGENITALPDGMVNSGYSSCYSRLNPDLPCVTITVNFVHPASNKCIHPHQDRALTPREGARLQSFEDSFRFIGNRSQIVKQIGNAVPPLLGKAIAEALFEQV